MGYFNGHSNWYEYAQYAGITRKCECCGKEFTPRSPNQKKHSYADWVEYMEACWLDDEINRLSARQYLAHVGETKISYIEKFGMEQYERVVLQPNRLTGKRLSYGKDFDRIRKGRAAKRNDCRIHGL